jgi:hypothetical protein
VRIGRSPDHRDATDLLEFLDGKHRAGCAAFQAGDASRPQQGLSARLTLDGVPGGALTPRDM